MKRLLLIGLVLLGALGLEAQNRNLTGTLTASSTDCAAAGSCVTLLKSANDAGIALEVTGTYTGTLQFEGTNGTTWSGLTGQPYISGTGVNSTTSTGAWLFATTGLTGFRIRASAYTSGTANIVIQAGSMPPGGTGGGGGGGGGTSSNFGNAFPSAGTAAGFIDAGGNMAGANLDGAGLLKTNCITGCAGASDTVGTTVSFASSTATAIVAVAGQQAIEVFIASGTLTSNLGVKVSYDGGATYLLGGANFIDPTSNQSPGSTQITLTNPNGNAGYGIIYPVGVSHVQIYAPGYTSGTANVTLRAVATKPWFVPYSFNGSNQFVPLKSNGASALLVDGSAVTQPVSITGQPVTVNFQTANLAENLTQINGNAASTVASGVLKIGIADSGANAMTTNSTTFSGKFGLDTNLLGTLGTAFSTAGKVDIKGADGDVFVRQATAANFNAQVVGNIASGASDSGNPVKIGGVFNTTQPTVTNGQRVDVQASARGAQIVSTGVDTFNVTINAALPAGGATIGAVTQASGPWTMNVTQFGSNNVVTGTGASGVGIPRVTVSNDSVVALTTGSSTIGIVNQGTPASGANAWPITITNTSDTVVKPGDSVNNAIRTNCVTGCSGAAAASFNAAFPSTGSAIGFNDPLGNMVRANVDYFGNQTVRIASIDTAALAGMKALNGSRITGTFNRPISSTGDALDVNLKYPPAVNDPCQGRKGFFAISQALSAQVITATPGMTTNICGIFANGADAENLSLVYGTGTLCGTGTVAMIGGTTAANGPNMAANGGWVEGFAGFSIAMAPPGQNVCLQQSGTGRVAGNLSFANSP